MAAGVADFLIEQGTTFSRTLTLTDSQVIPVPLNLTGYTARGMIKTSALDATPIVAFTFVFATDRTTGVLTMSLTDVQTSALPTTGTKYSSTTKYYYDVELIDATGVVTRLLNGAITVSPEITK